jgi:putative serine protease PepD
MSEHQGYYGYPVHPAPTTQEHVPSQQPPDDAAVAFGGPAPTPETATATTTTTPPVRRPGQARTVAVSLAAAVALATGSAAAGGYAALHLQPAQTSGTSAVIRDASISGGKVTLSDVAKAVLPAVVTIDTGTGSGSGVVITADGAILTNNHVVQSARGSSVRVTFADGRTATGQVVGADTANDLAVVKVAGTSGLTALRFGDSDAVRVGDTVLAVGSPLGLDGSVSSGIISATNRTIDEGQSRSGSGASIKGALQTDAAINPGNSGGALVNTAGDLIGINTAIATSGSGSGNIGVGFAISSNTAKTVADRLLNA